MTRLFVVLNKDGYRFVEAMDLVDCKRYVGPNCIVREVSVTLEERHAARYDENLLRDIFNRSEVHQEPLERCIYFIQSGTDGPIKIGIARDPNGRLRELQTANAHSLVLLALFVGTEETESELHARFASARLEGEWFSPSEELLRYVSLVKTRMAPSDWRHGARSVDILTCPACSAEFVRLVEGRCPHCSETPTP